MKRYAVKTTFGPTIQGEGLNAGRSCHFLRFAGCNAWDGRPETKAKSACPYCDTDFHGGMKMSADEVSACFKESRSHQGLVITGGEPLLQLDQPLLSKLCARFEWIDIETNGTVPLHFELPTCANVNISCSPKFISGHPIVIQPDWWKVLLPDQDRFLDMALNSAITTFVQPVMDPNDPRGPEAPSYKQAVEYCLQVCHDNPRFARMSLQLHKMIGVP
jgi:7-carboxy-7-deazaguanine synthase